MFGTPKESDRLGHVGRAPGVQEQVPNLAGQRTYDRSREASMECSAVADPRWVATADTTFSPTISLPSRGPGEGFVSDPECETGKQL